MSVPRFISFRFLRAEHATMYQLGDVRCFRLPTKAETRMHPGVRCMIEFYSVAGMHPLTTPFEDIEEQYLNLVEDEVNGLHTVE